MAVTIKKVIVCFYSNWNAKRIGTLNFRMQWEWDDPEKLQACLKIIEIFKSKIASVKYFRSNDLILSYL